MAKTLNIGILRCRDSKAFALTPALELACRQMFIAAPGRRSVMEYWTDLTDGYFQFTATLLPWVDVAYAASDAAADGTGKIDRKVQFDKTTAATRALPGFGDLSAYDAFVVLTGPGAAFPNPSASTSGPPATLFFDGGARRGTFAVFPLAGASHTFMCHEFGHVLGLPDSDGVLDLQGALPVDPGYGDPFDIMAAMRFAGSDPTFKGSPVPGWPNPVAMDAMGPAPSRAETHHFFPASVPAQYVRTVVAPDNNTPTLRLHAAYGSANATRLIVLDPATPGKDLVGRCYLEYRDAQGWDQGLDTSGKQWDRQGVVVHVLDKRIVPQVSAVDPTGVRAFFRGRIPFPLEIDSDLDIVGTPYTVRVTGGDVQGRYVDLKVTTSSILGFEITMSGGHVTVMTPDARRERRTTPCGDAIWWGRWLTVSTFAFRPMTWGLGFEGSLTSAPPKPPTIRWTVGGVTVPSLPTGILSGCLAPEGRFDVKYALDAASQTLTLTSGKEGQSYHMPIHSAASHELNGAVPVQDATFESSGSYVGYRPEDVGTLARCLRRVATKVRIDFRDLVLPDGTGPQPNWAVLTARLAERIRIVAPQFADEAKSLENLATLGSGK